MKARSDSTIALFAAGYFAAYVPYALLTKALTDGALGDHDGLALLAVTTPVSAIGMITFLAATGLWRRARTVRAGALSIPVPRATTWISGACTALIVVTTTLAYTFEGTSIVTMMLLMRGGVLVVAPIVDALARRPVRWFSWGALAISIAAVIVAVAPGPDRALAIAPLAALDALVYLAAYAGRLGLMSRSAKRDREANLRFFVEEQLVATPLACLAIAIGALVAGGRADATIEGALAIASGPALPWAIAIGLASQATGIFGALVLLDARENSFSVPVNRASSVLAGVVASAALAALLGGAWPAIPELAGAALVLVAIAVLSLGPRLHRDRARVPGRA